MFEPRLGIPGQKPVGPVEIDWSHPLAKGLYYSWLGGFGDVFPGETYDGVAVPSLEADYASFNGTDEYLSKTGTLNPGDYPLSGVMVFRVNSLASFCGLMDAEWSSGTNNYDSFYVFAETDGSFNVMVGDDTGTGPSSRRVYAGPASEISVGEWVVASFSLTSTTAGRICVNGSLSTATVAGTGTGFSTPDPTRYAGIGFLRVGATSYFGQSDQKSMAFFKREMSDDELVSLSRNPYQFLKPKAQLLKQPTLLINTQPDPLTYEYTVPDPKWEEPALLAGKKPTGPVVIDWEHPLAKGLMSCIPLTHQPYPVDMVSGAVFDTVTGSASIAATNRGLAADLRGNNKGFEAPVAGLRYTEGSMLWAGIMGSGNTNGSMGVYSYSGNPVQSPYISMAFKRPSGNNVYFQTSRNTAGIEANPSISDDSYHVYIGTFTAGDARVYEDGEEKATASWSGDLQQITGDTIYVGADYVAGSRDAGCDCLVMMAWDRVLTPAEVLEITRNPYAFLIPA